MKRLTVILVLLIAVATFVSCTAEKDEGNNFKMTATISELGEQLLVNVTEGEYSDGPFFIVYNEKTEIISADGRVLAVSELSVRDEVYIYYNGQVMLSYPPKVAATKIVVLNK